MLPAGRMVLSPLTSAKCAWLCLSVLPLHSLSAVLVGSLWVHDSQEVCACGHVFMQTVS